MCQIPSKYKVVKKQLVISPVPVVSCLCLLVFNVFICDYYHTPKTGTIETAFCAKTVSINTIILNELILKYRNNIIID